MKIPRIKLNTKVKIPRIKWKIKVRIPRIKLNTKVRTKLITSLIIICLVPLISMGIISYVQSKSILYKKLEVTSTQTLKEVNRGLTNYFKGVSNQVEMLANNSDVVNDGDLTLELFRSAKDNNPDIASIFYGPVDTDNLIVYPQGEEASYKSKEYYVKAISNKGKLVITQSTESFSKGRYVVSVAKTVEKDGKVVGVLGININLENLSKEFSSIKIGDNGYLFIFANNGIMLAHPDKSLIGTYSATKQSYWDTVTSNKNGFVTYKYGGKDRFAIYDTNDLTGLKMVASLEQAELYKDVNAILRFLIIFIVICTILSVIFSVAFSKGIYNSIEKLKDAFSKASKGDLTSLVKINTKDEFEELGQAFNLMVSNISDLVNSVKSSSNVVLETAMALSSMSEETTASVNEVSTAIGGVSEGASSQANNSVQSVITMKELSVELDEITESTKEMSSISNEAEILSATGLDMVNTLIEKSDQSRKASAQVSEVVNDMRESTNQINAISDTISRITKQTNLLSLNASIEAARAGDAGRGFSVVADEIKKLADQSNESTTEIKKIIENIQLKSNVVVDTINKSKEISIEHEKAVSETHKIFNDIMNSIYVLTAKVGNIQNFVDNIQTKKENVLGQIKNISSISEETAAASEEVTASAEEINATMEEFTSHIQQLKELSEQLEEEINKFSLK
jgi:Methyl-accepting chemotaxis protein